MTVLEIMKKLEEEREIRELAVNLNITNQQAYFLYYKNKLCEILRDEKSKLFNVKHVKYLDYEEYRLYKNPFRIGKRDTAYVRYENIDGIEYNSETKEMRTKESKENSVRASLRRTRQKIHDYIYANDWSNGYFFTITFDTNQVDSFDYDKCYKRVHQFLKNIKEQNADFKYIFVPEFHESGRIHFHGIGVNCEKLKLEESGNENNGKKIYNVASKTFKYGFTTVSKIEDIQKISVYIIKQIQPEMVSLTKGKHRYLCSKNLDKIDVENIILDNDDKDTFLKNIENNSKIIGKTTYNSNFYGNEVTCVRIKK